jgi:hypothetical protein
MDSASAAPGACIITIWRNSIAVHTSYGAIHTPESQSMAYLKYFWPLLFNLQYGIQKI